MSMDQNGLVADRFLGLAVGGFRRLHDVSLPLRPLTVLIGANGSGKTSVLEVLSLLAHSARGRLSSNLTDLAGLPGILTSSRAEEVRLGISMETPEGPELSYQVKLRPQGVGYTIAREELFQQRKKMPRPFHYIDSRAQNIKYFEPDQKKLVQPSWEHDFLETSLSQVPKMFRQPEAFRTRLASSTFYHVLNVEPRSPIRTPQPMRPATLPGRNGEDLISCLFYMQQTDRSRFEDVEDALRTAFPRFERLEFPPVAAGTLALTWREKDVDKPFYMHQLSEGTLRFLWLTTLLQSQGLTALTLLDEPEVSLHPELLSLLADLLRDASFRTQIVVATHSDRLIRFLEPKEVVVVDLGDDGLARLTWADELDLDRWLAEYSLDQLWQNGRLGGRP